MLDNEIFDEKLINAIDKKLMEVEQDEANGEKWLTREEADKLILGKFDNVCMA